MKLVVALGLIFMVGLVSAGLGGEIGLDLNTNPLDINAGGEYEINVNNSEYWNGNLWSDTRWLDIDGGNANQDIDIGGYGFSSGDIDGAGNLTIDVGTNSLFKVEPINVFGRITPEISFNTDGDVRGSIRNLLYVRGADLDGIIILTGSDVINDVRMAYVSADDSMTFTSASGGYIFDNNVTANYFIGNGSQLTGINGNNDSFNYSGLLASDNSWTGENNFSEKVIINNTVEFGEARTTGAYQAKVTNPTTLINVDGQNTDSIIYVVSTDGFSEEGYLAIYNSIISYTGKTATSFTGCSLSELGPSTLRNIGPSTGSVWDDIHQSESFLIDVDGSFATYQNIFNVFRDANNFIKATALPGKNIFQNGLLYNSGARGESSYKISCSSSYCDVIFYAGNANYPGHFVVNDDGAVDTSPLPNNFQGGSDWAFLVDTYLYSDVKKFFFGGAGDISLLFDGTNFIENLEIGTTAKKLWTNFAEYVFDNDVLVDGNLNVTGNISIKNPYGSWSSNESQVVAVADVVQVMNFSHEEDTYLMGIEGNENITVHKSGDYLITLSVVVVTDSSNKHFDVWPQTTHADGVTMANVPRSNTQIFIENAGTEQIISVSFILDLHEMDKFRIMYGSDDADSMTVWHDGHGTGVNAVPETPSIIMTVTKISEITD